MIESSIKNRFSWEHAMSPALLDSAVNWPVIKWNNNSVGSITLNIDDESKSINIDNVVASPSAQSHGYGRVFMDYARDLAWLQG